MYFTCLTATNTNVWGTRESLMWAKRSTLSLVDFKKKTHPNRDILERNKQPSNPIFSTQQPPSTAREMANACYFHTLSLTSKSTDWVLGFLTCLIWHLLLLLYRMCFALNVYKAICHFCFLLAEDLCHCIRMILQWPNSSPPWIQKQQGE